MLERSSAPPLVSSLSSLIARSSNTRQLQQIHSQILTSSTLNPPCTFSLLTRLLFSLISLSSSSLSYASSLFNLIPSPTLSAYNAIIRAHSNNPSPSFSLTHPISLYSRMLASRIRPDHLTFPFLIKCCSRHRAHLTGQAIHAHIFRFGFRGDVFIQNSFIFMYCSCRHVELARKVFDEMLQRDIVSENSMLIGYLRCGELDAALGLFLEMEERNVRTWNSIIAGFVQGRRCREALDLFHEMLMISDNGGFVKPDKITVASVVSACASLGALDQGRWVHGYLKRQGLEFDVVIGTALIDMYGKCGCVERAFEVFQEMPKRDVLAWSAMISVLAVHGLGGVAFFLLEEMEKNGTRPNHVTFGALLSACAHSGMVEKGLWCFDAMKRIYSIEPQLQHYACMVDLLGRAGLFEEAQRLIGGMAMEPDSFVWGALLGACRMHGNVELGERVAGYLIALDPLNHAYYIILSDIYANAKRFEDVKRIRAFMKVQGIEKTSPGCSLIEIDGQVYEFSIKGIQKELIEEIDWVLNGITGGLKWTGYFPDDNIELLQAT